MPKSFCSKCQADFDNADHFPWNCFCESCSICNKCYESDGDYTCEHCNGDFEKDYYFIQWSKERKLMEQSSKVEKAANKKLIEEIAEHKKAIVEKNHSLAEMKKKLEGLESAKKDLKNASIECSGCGYTENENRFDICRTCTKIQAKVDISNIEDSSEVNIKRFAICSTCAIRNHINIGHKVVDFYSILASNNYSKQVAISNEICTKINKGIGRIENMTRQWVGFGEDGKNEVSTMTDMVRRGKTSMAQEEIGKRVAEKSEKLLRIIDNAADRLEKIGNDFIVELKIARDENSNIENEKCFTNDEIQDSKVDFKTD